MICTSIKPANSSPVHLVNQNTMECSLVYKRLQYEVGNIAFYIRSLMLRPKVHHQLHRPISTPLLSADELDGFKHDYGSLEPSDSLNTCIYQYQQIGEVLESFVRKSRYVILGYFVSKDGLFVLDDDKVLDNISAVDEFEPVKTDWFLGTVKQRETIWTDPYVDANTKKHIITIATPVFDNRSKLIGVAGFDILMDTIRKELLSLLPNQIKPN